VIAAGYPAPMVEFLAANPGLASRFTGRVQFPDYFDAELLQILQAMAAADEFTLTPQAEQRALAWFAAERAARPDAFGNGRAARNLLGEMQASLGARIAAAEVDESQLSIFEAENVPDARA
jgi:hypothetical protein